jgi:hypothetical protein
MLRYTYTALLVTFLDVVETVSSGISSDLDSVACYFHSRGQNLSLGFNHSKYQLKSKHTSLSSLCFHFINHFHPTFQR